MPSYAKVPNNLLKLKDEFIGWMDAFNHDDLPDGAWWAVLEEGAEKFKKKYKLRKFDTNSAVHQYLKWRN